MRKYIIGFVIGIGVSSAFGASAAVEGIIGKAIEGTAAVKIEGKKLDKESIIVDGSSYAPVRAIGEALGLDVGFKNGEVILDKKKEATKVNETEDIPLDDKIKFTKEAKDGYEKSLERSQVLQNAAPEDQKSIYDNEIKVYKERIEQYKAQIADLERQKADLQK
ncbi:hypothetical protein WMW72_10590 [Paenibacillus filicis]|uniref:Copper amine oxidase N-terminal domain-containing protein n=1 Tax=Paenibacillus filicis TaxID=669464 RepID=A0ABU9DHM7_9BACL